MVATQHRTRTLNRLAIAGRVVGNQPQPKSHIRPNLSQFGNDKSLKYTQNHLHRVGSLPSALGKYLIQGKYKYCSTNYNSDNSLN